MGAIDVVKVSNVSCTCSSLEVPFAGSAVTVLRSNGAIDDGSAFCREVPVKVMTLTGQVFGC